MGFVITCFLLAALCFVIWILKTLSDQNSRATGAGDEPGAALVLLSHQRGEMMNNALVLPDVFDEQRICADLQRLADQPNLFAQYVEQARHRFTKTQEIKILEHWTEYFRTGKAVVEAKTELRRAQHSYHQLDYEEEIKRKEKEVTLAKLEAEEREHKLRAAKADHQLKTIGQQKETAQISEEEQKMQAAKKRVRQDIHFKVHTQAGQKLTTLFELQRWRKEQRRQIIADSSLTLDEQEEQLELLDEEYHREKKKLEQPGVKVFEEEV